MTIEERLAIIENKAKQNKAEEQTKENKLAVETQQCLRQVKELQPRVDALIVLSNKCNQEKIMFPELHDTMKYGYGEGSVTFIADGIYHHVGFMDCNKGWWKSGECPYKPIEYIGIKMGGACGVWDLYVNGNELFLKREGTDERKEAGLCHLRQFLKEFDSFESAFYKWIDSMAE